MSFKNLCTSSHTDLFYTGVGYTFLNQIFLNNLIAFEKTCTTFYSS